MPRTCRKAVNVRLRSIDLTIRAMSSNLRRYFGDTLDESYLPSLLTCLRHSTVGNKIRTLKIITSDYNNSILTCLQAFESLERFYWPIAMSEYIAEPTPLKEIESFLTKMMSQKLKSLEIRFPNRV